MDGLLATGSDLPNELLPIIVGYVVTEDNQRLRDLATCSLVSVEWAQRCRPVLFRSITVKSLERFEAIISSRISPLLTPIASLVRDITVVQDWHSWSWCHRLAGCSLDLYPVTRLVLQGPVPAYLPRCAYRSVQWSLPRTLPDPLFPFYRVTLRDIHFPSLSDLRRLLGSMHPEQFDLKNLTWADSDIAEACRAPRASLRMLRPDDKYLNAEGCTDNILLCLLMPCTPLSARSVMLTRERDAVSQMHAALRDLPARGHHTCMEAGIMYRAENDHGEWSHSVGLGMTFTPLKPESAQTVQQVLALGLIETGPSLPGRLPMAHVTSIQLLFGGPTDTPSPHELPYLVQSIQLLRSLAPLFSQLRSLRVEGCDTLLHALSQEVPELEEHPHPGEQFEYDWEVQ